MKTEHVEEAGVLRVMLREDGGVYLAEVDPPWDYRVGLGGERPRAQDPIRVGSSAAICSALSEAFARMAEHIRSKPKDPTP